MDPTPDDIERMWAAIVARRHPLRNGAECPRLQLMTAPAVATENSVAVSVPMMPGRNGGTLRRGNLGGKGGPKPSKIRKKAMRLLWQHVDVLGHIAAGATVEFGEGGAQELVTPKPGERVAAIKVLAELGMGERVAVSDVRSRIRAQLAIISEQETWTREELVTRLQGVWA